MPLETSADAASPRIRCGHCPEAVPAQMQSLMEHARGHALSISRCFPLELSDETQSYIRQLR